MHYTSHIYSKTSLTDHLHKYVTNSNSQTFRRQQRQVYVYINIKPHAYRALPAVNQYSMP